MNNETKTGSKQLWLAMAAVCLMFFVSIFYPLYFTSTYASDRTINFIAFLFFAFFALSGKRWARIGIGAIVMLLMIFNMALLLVYLNYERLVLSLVFGVVSASFTVPAYVLLTSKDIRVIEVSSSV